MRCSSSRNRWLSCATTDVVSFPCLPGSNSASLSNFSVFVGELVTFGTSGFIGNLLAGILLTYAHI